MSFLGGWLLCQPSFFVLKGLMIRSFFENGNQVYNLPIKKPVVLEKTTGPYQYFLSFFLSLGPNGAECGMYCNGDGDESRNFDGVQQFVGTRR